MCMNDHVYEKICAPFILLLTKNKIKQVSNQALTSMFKEEYFFGQAHYDLISNITLNLLLT